MKGLTFYLTSSITRQISSHCDNIQSKTMGGGEHPPKDPAHKKDVEERRKETHETPSSSRRKEEKSWEEEINESESERFLEESEESLDWESSEWMEDEWTEIDALIERNKGKAKEKSIDIPESTNPTGYGILRALANFPRCLRRPATSEAPDDEIDAATAELIAALRLEDAETQVREDMKLAYEMQGELYGDHILTKAEQEKFDHELAVYRASCERMYQGSPYERPGHIHGQRTKIRSHFPVVEEVGESSATAAARQTIHGECVACVGNFDVGDLIQIPSRHEYCRDCLLWLFEHSMKDDSLFPLS
jgi:hypothetical protein